MIYANRNGVRVQAEPNAQATCPGCQGDLVAKCGEVNVWHWAHVSTVDCDPWHEGESAWHMNWKKVVPSEWREVATGPHRADIRHPDGFVVELQHSALSPEEIREREAFYGNMCWILDARNFNIDLRNKGDYESFRWRWPNKAWFVAKKPIFFDFGIPASVPLDEHQRNFYGIRNRLSGMLQVEKIYPNLPCGGWGHLGTHEEFLRELLCS